MCSHSWGVSVLPSFLQCLWDVICSLLECIVLPDWMASANEKRELEQPFCHSRAFNRGQACQPAFTPEARLALFPAVLSPLKLCAAISGFVCSLSFDSILFPFFSCQTCCVKDKSQSISDKEFMMHPLSQTPVQDWICWVAALRWIIQTWSFLSSHSCHFGGHGEPGGVDLRIFHLHPSHRCHSGYILYIQTLCFVLQLCVCRVFPFHQPHNE